MACGGRMYYVAIGATFILIAAQYILHLPFRIFRMPKVYSIKIEFVQTTDENLRIKAMFGTERFNKLLITREDGLTIYSATLNTEKEISATRLNQIMEENAFIRSLERCDHE
jgi:hypothetical protein